MTDDASSPPRPQLWRRAYRRGGAMPRSPLEHDPSAKLDSLMMQNQIEYGTKLFWRFLPWIMPSGTLAMTQHGFAVEDGHWRRILGLPDVPTARRDHISKQCHHMYPWGHQPRFIRRRGRTPTTAAKYLSFYSVRLYNNGGKAIDSVELGIPVLRLYVPEAMPEIEVQNPTDLRWITSPPMECARQPRILFMSRGGSLFWWTGPVWQSWGRHTRIGLHILHLMALGPTVRSHRVRGAWADTRGHMIVSRWKKKRGGNGVGRTGWDGGDGPKVW
jgi:hypothetical protein